MCLSGVCGGDECLCGVCGGVDGVCGVIGGVMVFCGDVVSMSRLRCGFPLCGCGAGAC